MSLRFRFLAYKKVAAQMPAPSIKIKNMLVIGAMPKCKFFKPLKINMDEISMQPKPEMAGIHV